MILYQAKKFLHCKRNCQQSENGNIYAKIKCSGLLAIRKIQTNNNNNNTSSQLEWLPSEKKQLSKSWQGCGAESTILRVGV